MLFVGESRGAKPAINTINKRHNIDRRVCQREKTSFMKDFFIFALNPLPLPIAANSFS
jgi:hypothetical protein